MAYGIYAQPVGPGPAAPAPLFIDSNLTFPQFLGSYGGFVSWQATSYNFTVGNFDGQGTLVLVPTSTLIQPFTNGTDLIPTFSYLKSMSISGSNVSCSLEKGGNNDNRRWTLTFNAYKLWPTGDQSYGISFSNSVNFFAISDSGVVGQCAWAYRGSVGDGFVVPNTNANSVVFAGWSQDGVTAAYDSATRQMIICANHSNWSSSNRGATIGDMRILVFNNSGGVPEHNGGLNIYSPNGQQCVFSTYNSPFSINGFVSSAGSSTGIGVPMIPLSKSIGSITEVGGNFLWCHNRSYTMSGGNIGTGWGPIVTSWDRAYDLRPNVAVGITIPVIDAAKYFA